MPSIERPLHADLLHFDLDSEEKEAAARTDVLERDGRSGRTLLKDGPLRVTLIVLGPGGDIPEHTAQGPVTVQPLRGEVEVTAGGETRTVTPDGLLALGPDVAHTVRSDDGATLLLTVGYREAR